MQSQHTAQRSRNLYKVGDIKPYKISRSKIEDFLSCNRCFYLDRKCGVKKPQPYPYTLNNAVDKLLKKEFDIYRVKKEKHPYFLQHDINAIPFNHPNMEKWRTNQSGARYLHSSTNLLIYGSVDDIWVNDKDEKILIVDYKATGVKEISTLYDSYKRQMEIYQWLFRRIGFKVSPTGYFLYFNADTDREKLDGALRFNTTLLAHAGDDLWVEQTLFEIKECLDKNQIPESSLNCDYCAYWHAVEGHINKQTIN